MVLGEVPADWRHRRLTVRVTPEASVSLPALAFLDVEAPETRAVLRRVGDPMVRNRGTEPGALATKRKAPPKQGPPSCRLPHLRPYQWWLRNRDVPLASVGTGRHSW